MGISGVLGMYFASIMLMCSLSVVFTVLVLNCHYRTPDTHQMPRWVRGTFSLIVCVAHRRVTVTCSHYSFYSVGVSRTWHQQVAHRSQTVKPIDSAKPTQCTTGCTILRQRQAKTTLYRQHKQNITSREPTRGEQCT